MLDFLQERTDLRKYLFDMGFLITDAVQANTENYPYYGNWKYEKVGKYCFYVHNRQRAYFYTAENKQCFFLIGHAYNPYTMDWDENKILQKLSEAYGGEAYTDMLDSLTGIFIYGVITGDAMEFLLDCSGMQYGCYGLIDGHLYISSHTQLLGDICALEQTDYVKRLVAYKWYHYMMGNYLPGDITPYAGVTRIIPNTRVTFDGTAFKTERFYPRAEIKMCKNESEYAQVIEEAARIMQNNMALIPKKWEKPAISLTGGIDSNTTFAAAAGNYEKYTAFSYVSMQRENVDAQYAEQISQKFHVPFQKYIVPETNDETPDFALYKAIFIHNDGNIGTMKDNEVRKKVTLMQHDVCDVEVKSWISETIRAYAYKYFGRTKMPAKLTPRNYTSLYKIFFMNRKLVWETDKYFKQYLANTQLKERLFNYDESDFFVWEMMHGGKCGLNIGVMKSCFDITIPYNNRKLLDLLLRIPLKDRLSDAHHMALKKYMNKDLYDMHIRVVNLNETKSRKRMANLYFMINSHLPF